MVDNKEKVFSERIAGYMNKNEEKKETLLGAKDFSLGFLSGISLSMFILIYRTFT